MFGKQKPPQLHEVIVTCKPEGANTNMRKAVSPVHRWGPMGLEAAEACVVEMAGREDVIETRIEPVKQGATP